VSDPAPPRWAWWEFAWIALMAAVSFVLAGSNLAEPSLWHDELIHVFVAQSIADTGAAELPSGEPYFSGALFNYLLAAVVAVFGVSEAVVRAPSVVFGVCNVALTYWLVRPLLGRPAAMLAAAALACSPWTVAWAREARFYALQQSLYLVVLGAYWRAIQPEQTRGALWLGLTVAAYWAAVLTSYHSLLFLGPLGIYALALLVIDADRRRGRAVDLAALTASGGVAVALAFFLMNPVDRDAVLGDGKLGGALVESARAVRWYYLTWLRENLSLGVFIVALGGFVWMLTRGRPGVYAALAFWVPLLLLTFLVGYRRPRFLFFAYPLYVAAFAYGLTGIGHILNAYRRSLLHALAAAAVLLFSARLALSLAYLTQDSIEVARGAHTTLARRHPQWRVPGEYVREHRKEEAVLTTTYLPARYYTGHVTNWYPNRYTPWEKQESGLDGLPDLTALRAWLADHPRGYFLAERWRFERWQSHGHLQDTVLPEVQWVAAHMERIPEASTDDVTLYHWDFTDGVPPPLGAPDA